MKPKSTPLPTTLKERSITICRDLWVLEWLYSKLAHVTTGYITPSNLWADDNPTSPQHLRPNLAKSNYTTRVRTRIETRRQSLPYETKVYPATHYTKRAIDHNLSWFMGIGKTLLKARSCDDRLHASLPRPSLFYSREPINLYSRENNEIIFIFFLLHFL